jgi:hypothetical protein
MSIAMTFWEDLKVDLSSFTHPVSQFALSNAAISSPTTLRHFFDVFLIHDFEKGQCFKRIKMNAYAVRQSTQTHQQ